MNLELFFLEIITKLNTLAQHDKRHPRSFGFQSNGQYDPLIKDLQRLIRNYRSMKPIDLKANRELYQSIRDRNKLYNLKLFDTYMEDYKLHTAIKNFLRDGPPKRME